MESVPPAPAPASARKSLLERAYLDAVEQIDDGDGTRTRLLDAAFEQFCRSGIQRSSMEEVARRAGLSRITLYRKFATKDALVDQVILREFSRYFARFLDDIAHADDAAERVVLGFVSSLRAIRGNPLIGGLIATEPTLLAGSTVGGDGRILATVRQFVAGQLRREQRAGSISDDLDTDLAAEMMVRVTASFLTIPSRIIDLDDESQLGALAWQFLVPMLEPSPPRR
ncbi:DNA-binding transcriptional regulator, AcrR family [Rhodococcus triatomae]|uniref:DNA-binding transcriptional regulator, AcrR family n=1 Tax=Rhodococcus triatomae TaxID=300028 RepID=A0A1G8JPL0_9NOCA|nr:DNA-binding transcriptional regulator, AcrR family [Rhodococcus triatomae]